MTLPDGRHVFAKWVPHKKADRPGLRSRRLPSLYSPFRPWLDIVLQFLRVKDDPVLFPDFVNDVLAETSETRIKTPEAHWLMARAESDWHRGDPAPKGVLFITLAADIQADRIEAGIIGWGKDRESWILDYWVFEGTPADVNSSCWKALEEKIDHEYIRIDGYNLGRPLVSMIDAGYLPDQVNHFCAQYVYSPKGFDGVYPCRGKENLSNIWKAYANDIATPMIHLHDQRLKGMIYQYLSRDPPVKGAALPIGYTHFPQGYSIDWYKQLTAEELHSEVDRRGRTKHIVTNPHQRRNEVLDVVKMNWAAVYFAYMRFFEIRNKALKLQGRNQIEADWSVFWRLWEEEEHGEEIG
jgi:phage terminase large subunit GpA-like protein